MSIVSKNIYQKPQNLETINPESLSWDEFKKLAYSCEYLKDSSITRLYYDFDYKYENTDNLSIEELEIEFNLYMNSIIPVLNNKTKIRDFVYTDGSYFDETGYKISFHVIFCTLFIEREKFDVHSSGSKDMIKRIFNGIENDEIKNDICNSVDSSVYGKKWWFRLPYGKMNGKKTLHIPQKNTELCYYFVTNLYDPFDKHEILKWNKTEPSFQKELSPQKESEDAKADIASLESRRADIASLESRRADIASLESRRADKEAENDMNDMVDMLEMVKKERFQIRDEWMKLFFLIKGQNLSKELFIRYSKESNYKNFSEEECNSLWYKTEATKGWGFPLIHRWLEEDGINWIELFCKKKKTMISDLLKAFYDAGTLHELSISEIFFKHYKDNLICTNQGWFHFNQNIGWTLGADNTIIYPLMKLIGERFINYSNKLKMKDGEDEKEFIKKVKTLKKEAVRLCSVSFCDKIIKMCKSPMLFYDEKAVSKFDEKPSWFCFSDMKAIDLKTKKIIDISATDKILTTCGYSLPERKEEDIEKVKKLLSTIIPEKNIKSFLSSLSLFLYGDNINEKFIVFRGEGRNGKGLTINLLEIVLGKYFYSLPTEILTEHSKGAGRASPDIMGSQFARCVISSEPDASKHIVKTTINLLTGRDSISARQLHEKTVSFKPKFTLGMMCNDLPNISGGINDAIKNRLVIQDFPYRFKPEEEIDKNNNNHKVIDTTMKDKVKNDISFRNGLLYLLIDTWAENQGKYISNDDSKEEQENYAKQNNPVIPFLDNYEMTDDSFIRIQVLHKLFRSNYDDTITTNKFKNYLEEAKIKIIDDKKNGHKVYIKNIF